MDLTQTHARLADFAATVGDTPPATILDQDGGFSDALRQFRQRHDLTLDWIIAGEGPQFRRLTPGDAEAVAYRAVNLLSVCARALENDEFPADDCSGFAVAQTIGIAIKQLHSVIDVLEAADRRKGPSVMEDSPSALYDQWKALRGDLKSRVDAAGGNDPETPEFLALSDQEDALGQKIASATPRTDADAAAMLMWTFDDGNGEVSCDLYLQAQRAVAKYLTGQS